MGLFNKKYIYILVLLLTIIAIMLTGILTAFLLTNFGTVFIGKNEDWLSFYGSIIGGLSGGMITMFGVVYTLNHNKKENRDLTQLKRLN